MGLVTPEGRELLDTFECEQGIKDFYLSGTSNPYTKNSLSYLRYELGTAIADKVEAIKIEMRTDWSDG